MSLDRWLEQSSLITFIGTGGVGKTSLSLIAAIRAAQLGRKVAAITIDPSRRLSTVLNLTGPTPSPVKWQEFAHPLDVYNVDTTALFSEFVSMHLPGELFSKLGQNKIFQQISGNLRETHHFASLFQFVQVVESRQYDLIVLDTPPCHQVIDFFESPQRLQKIFASPLADREEGWTSWVTNQGLKVAEQVMQTMVGKEFVAEMDSFFRGIGGLRKNIDEVSRSFMSHLQSSDAKLALVFSEALDKLAEAQYLRQSLSEIGYEVDSFIMNRAFSVGHETLPSFSGDTNNYESQLYQKSRERLSHSKALLQTFRGQNKQVNCILLPEVNSSLLTEKDLRLFLDNIKPHWLEV